MKGKPERKRKTPKILAPERAVGKRPGCFPPVVPGCPRRLVGPARPAKQARPPHAESRAREAPRGMDPAWQGKFLGGWKEAGASQAKQTPNSFSFLSRGRRTKTGEVSPGKRRPRTFQKGPGMLSKRRREDGGLPNSLLDGSALLPPSPHQRCPGYYFCIACTIAQRQDSAVPLVLGLERGWRR